MQNERNRHAPRQSAIGLAKPKCALVRETWWLHWRRIQVAAAWRAFAQRPIEIAVAVADV